MHTTDSNRSRRQFCQRGLGAGLGISAGLPAIALGAEKPDPGGGHNAHGAFASSFSGVAHSYNSGDIRFSGKLPNEIKGVLFRNGPALMQRGDMKYKHWFDGDGMVHAFRFGENKVAHQAEMVRTRRHIAEEKADRFLWNGFGTSFADTRPTTSPDSLNVANISVLPLGDELLALWEAGSPWRLRADNLETIGRHVFSADTDGMPFSAHPRIDPNGKIWNFGYLSGSGKMALYQLDKRGALERVSLIDAPNADMVHDFAITERHLVFVLVPLRFDMARMQGTTPGNNSGPTFMDALNWDNSGSVHVLLVGKDSLQVEHRFELPPFFFFHLGNAWQDRNSVHIEVAVAPGFDNLMRDIVDASAGQPVDQGLQSSGASEITLNLEKGTASMQQLPTQGVEFPRFDQRFTGQRTNHLFMLGASPTLPTGAFGLNSVTALDRTHSREQTFDYGADILAEEHVFVPGSTARSGSGWLVGTAYNWKKQRTVLSVFNAQQIADGPVAQATMPYGLPMGLHGQYATHRA